MGRGYTTRDTEYGSTRSATVDSSYYGSSSYSQNAEKKMRNSQASPDCSPKRVITSYAKNPIAIGIDGTGSVGEGAFVVWDKIPILFGQLKTNYVADPEISLFAIGDHKYDNSPLQTCEFAQGDEIEEQCEKIYIEGGGGGNGKESYEHAGVYYLKRASLREVEKGFLYFIGDEKPYPKVDVKSIKNILDIDVKEMTTKDLFKQLRKKYEVCFIQFPYCGHPKSMSLEITNIKNTWGEYIGHERVLYLTDPKGVIDVILGATALLNNTRTLEDYLEDLKGENGIREEGQTPERIEAVKKALTPLWKQIGKNGTSNSHKRTRIQKVLAAAKNKKENTNL